MFLQLLAASIENRKVPEVLLTADEWKRIMELSKRHNVFPLIFETASTSESFINLPEYQHYAIDTMAIVAGQTRRTEAFLSLYSQFLKADIIPIVMKGLNCRQLYNEYCDHRPSGDEDILIRKEDYKQIQKIFVENGYVQEYNDITSKQLDEIQEITFYSFRQG